MTPTTLANTEDETDAFDEPCAACDMPSDQKFKGKPLCQYHYEERLHREVKW